MKIILSPAKNMNLNTPVDQDWTLNLKSQALVDLLKDMTDDDLKKSLKINDSVLGQVKSYLEAFDMKKSYQAIDLYDGLSFRWLKKENLSEEDLSYLNDHLVILSALYGPIKPDTLIKAYRLDFNSSLKIENKSLKTFWKNDYNIFFEDEDLIINLASEEFSSLLDRKKLKLLDFEFFEATTKDGEKILKKHSTISKKARGQMLAFMAKNKIQEPKDLKAFNYDNYTYSADMSSEDKLVFIKEL